MRKLQEYRKNIHSQNGEDGVIEEIFKRLSITEGEFVEFGAWDGKHLSNTYNLLTKKWKGIYIEGDELKYKDLCELKKEFPNHIETICAYVSDKGNNTLDNLLSRTAISTDFDLLSIDIDSFDWHVWSSLKGYRPKVVIIEINSSIPPGVIQTHRNDAVMGSSFSATVTLGKSKGYSLVCHTGNLFFVRDDFISKMGLSQTEIDFPELLFDYTWCADNKVMTYYNQLKPKGFFEKLKTKFRSK